MIEGDVRKILWQLTLPMMVGILSVTIMSLVDSFYLGYLGESALAAVAFTLPITSFLFNVAIGLSIGCSTCVARAIGAREEERINRISSQSLLLGASIFFVIITLVCSNLSLLLDFLGAEQANRQMILEYLLPQVIGLFFHSLTISITGILRGFGDTKSVARLMVLSSACSIIISPLLIFTSLDIFGFKVYLMGLGILGSSVATCVARFLAFLLAISKLRTRVDFSFNTHHFTDTLKSVLPIAFPAMLTNTIVPISAGVITRFVADFGEDAIAAYGVCSRLENTFLILYLAFSSVVGGFMAQNLGANRVVRCLEIKAYLSKVCYASGLILAILLLLFNSYLGKLFSEDTGVLLAIATYMSIVPWGYGSHGIILAFNASLNGLSLAKRATFVSLTRLLLLGIPLAYLFKQVYGLPGVFYGIVLGNVLAGILSHVVLKRSLENGQNLLLSKRKTA